MKKLLIANRGEIACRVIETARQLGIATVAIYSTPDANARHVALADEAVHVGDAAPQSSYLDQASVLNAAHVTGADAVHPGYGFLSENAEFSAACAAAGVTFVGPPSQAIEAMGSKSGAKSIMEKAGVPLLPGYHGDDQSDATLSQAADDIGYPVLLKATAGGGGKGMRIVEADGDFVAALQAARQEAMSAFGDDRMLVEKFLATPRHVEVQVFADQHGNCVHLFDRDCSIQRRYQKIIEEAPAPGLSDALRQRMASAAVAAAKAINYVGAGTVEFLVDNDDFYFMEMNTRLQVEHPVTEAITGVDLVAWQLTVADGQPIPSTQAELRCTGHAVEARIYAEDADGGFLPTPGPVTTLRWPDTSPAPRIDTGVRQGDIVSIHYDPMIAKMICHSSTRSGAIRALQTAMRDTLIGGLTTNIDFLLRVLGHEQFQDSIPTTAFLSEHADALQLGTPDDAVIAASALILWNSHMTKQPTSPWHLGNGWWPNITPKVAVRLSIAEQDYDLSIRFERRTPIAVEWHDRSITIDDVHFDGESMVLAQNGIRTTARFIQVDNTWCVAVGSRQWWVYERAPDLGEAAERASDGTIKAPMTGKVVEVAVGAGDTVAAGDTLLVMEAMKMAHTLTAPVDGTVAECRAHVGELVDGGQVLAIVKPKDSELG
ncbi:MAG: biotin carboxylase N-terminal domain-containing protein [Pseudomonadota bacterium]